MKSYRDYMDRQQVSSDLHQRLLELQQQQNAPKRSHAAQWKKLAALAASLCVVVGLGWFSMTRLGLGGSSEAACDTAAAEEPAAYASSETSNEAYDDADSVMADMPAEAAPMEEEGVIGDTAAQEPGEEPQTEAASEEWAEEDSAKVTDDGEAITGTYGYLSYSPEGYTLAFTEESEDTQVICWEKGDDRITAQRMLAPIETLRGDLEEQGYPVYAGDSEDWKSADAAAQGQQGWGFVLDWGEMLEFYTSTEGPDDLWIIVEELQNYEW